MPILPNLIDQYEVQYGDRPYAGVLMFKTFLIAENAEKKSRVSVSFNAGVLGPWAGGEQMQETIHHWINYTQPEGWHNQIQNDLVLNYQINTEKEFIQYENHFSLSGFGSARLGTLSDKLTGGFTSNPGKFPFRFAKPPSVKSSFEWYLFCQVLGNAVAYDATLQGGVFNHSSVYTIEADEIKRFTLQNKWGMVLKFRSVYLEYTVQESQRNSEPACITVPEDYNWVSDSEHIEFTFAFSH